MHIIENNPVCFVVEFTKAVADGWKLKDCNAGRPSHSLVHQLQLFKGFTPEVQRITSEFHLVDEYDSFEFLKQIQNALLNGFELDVKSVRWDTAGKKFAKLTNPNYVTPAVYTKAQLEEMQYEDLKKVAKQLDSFHRSRDIMIVKILEKQKEV